MHVTRIPTEELLGVRPPEISNLEINIQLELSVPKQSQFRIKVGDQIVYMLNNVLFTMQHPDQNVYNSKQNMLYDYL